jgi:hypothetical protein
MNSPRPITMVDSATYARIIRLRIMVIEAGHSATMAIKIRTIRITATSGAMIKIQLIMETAQRVPAVGLTMFGVALFPWDNPPTRTAAKALPMVQVEPHMGQAAVRLV